VYLFLVKLILASLVMGGILSGIHQMLTRLMPPTTFVPAMIICIVTGLVFLMLMPVAARLLRIPEIMTFYEKTARRLLSWQKKPPRS
jgi:putative peptidoglycan lipid II flippase